MISEQIEFVGSFFDDMFEDFLTADRRIPQLRKYVKTICNSRINRVPESTANNVIFSVQIMDHFKHVEGAFASMFDRINNGTLMIEDAEGNSVCDVVIMSFGDEDSKPNGWKGSIQKFMAKMGDHAEGLALETMNPYTRSFYLRFFPKEIIPNPSETDFFIFGIINRSKPTFDAASLNVIGYPAERAQDILKRNIRETFMI